MWGQIPRQSALKLEKKKGLQSCELQALDFYGRRGGIRTRDPLHPMQVRYQAALHAED